ncbi:hypothetical protein [Dyadobacter frigoris]|uniref:hypothetical protein n=1 Tax=Dyadobacter frigoris TaxID=2576211 RepID=UPI001484F03C|nr:hypothetical protein [Dyadobacter frigoris]GLU56203.1 hypothetical protein Dfri01_56640 [Dyadobacter frigoris]
MGWYDDGRFKCNISRRFSGSLFNNEAVETADINVFFPLIELFFVAENASSTFLISSVYFVVLSAILEEVSAFVINFTFLASIDIATTFARKSGIELKESK